MARPYSSRSSRSTVADKKGGNLALIFGGGGGDAAAPGDGPSSDADDYESESGGGELDDLLGAEGEDAEATMPPDFALNAAEAFPDLAGDDARIEALYRTIKSCHPGV